MGQMLTAGVGLEAVGGACLHWLWGRGRGLMWRPWIPPPPCVHERAHTLILGWVGRTIPPFKMLPRQVLPASWEEEGKTT